MKFEEYEAKLKASKDGNELTDLLEDASLDLDLASNDKDGMSLRRLVDIARERALIVGYPNDMQERVERYKERSTNFINELDNLDESSKKQINEILKK